MDKYNLTIIDKNPEIKNFLYVGVSSNWIEKIRHDFKDGVSILHFEYDEGEVLVSSDLVHSLVISPYAPIEELESEVEA